MNSTIVRDTMSCNKNCNNDNRFELALPNNLKGPRTMTTSSRHPFPVKLSALILLIALFLSLAGPTYAAEPHVLSAATANCTTTPTGELEILIPLYIYPNHWDPSYVWDEVATAACQVPITAIINPDSGQISGPPNTDYETGLTDLRDAGVTMLGYVYTNNGTRNLSEVKANIKAYNDFYDIDGIFLDEADAPTELAYYQDLYTYINTLPNLDRVVVNPGRHIPESFINSNAADAAVIFESYGTNWPDYSPDAYVQSYPSDHFAVMAHSVTDEAFMRSYIDLAVERNIRYVYVTDELYAKDGYGNLIENPWDALASYWQAEVDYIGQKNAEIENAMGEVGLIDDELTHEPKTVQLRRHYSNPVVFAQPLSYDGGDTSVVRITDVQADSFTLYVHEAPDQNGAHARTESVSYIVLEAGLWDLPNGARLEVDTVNTTATTGSQITPRTWLQINFASTFSAMPVVISQVQSNNDPTWVKTRQRLTDNMKFEVAMEPADSATTPHAGETIAWLALTNSSGNWDGHLYEANLFGGVTHNWKSLSFAQDFTAAPRFLGAVGSYVGGNGVTMRYDRQSLTATGVNIMLEEDTTVDTEVEHYGETIRYLAIEGDGLLTATAVGSVQAAKTVMTIDESGMPAEGDSQHIFLPVVNR